ncbi:MAG TPA: hypothetical protein VKT81_04090 [Bryobacteraceae bacterium]|nr:hypothetical protein [Bryobacteraceae bacterium]
MPDLAYLAQGKLHLRGDHGSRTVESAFGRSLRERAAQIQNRHAWKTQGRGAQFMRGTLWAEQGRDPGEFRIAITSIASGRESGELIYSLETDDVSGIFRVDADGVEQRLFHTADFRVRHIALDLCGENIAASIFRNNFTSNLALLPVEGSGCTEVTDGDSFDIAPRWVPGSQRRLVFQSAGLGRDGNGRFRGLGPFGIHELDLDSGEMDCVAEESGFDLLGPQKTADGALYYIRRPHHSVQENKTSPAAALKDTVLFPFRMGFAIFQFFNFFSMRYTGKPLATSRGAIQRQPDLKQMLVWGNLIDADRAARENGLADTEAPDLVPNSWQLVRRTAQGTTDVVATNVLSFDISRDGSVLYSNGSAIHRMKPGESRGERILVGNLIEQVTALS